MKKYTIDELLINLKDRYNNLNNKNIIDYLPTIVDDIYFFVFEYRNILDNFDRNIYYNFNNNKLQKYKIKYLITLIKKYMKIKYNKNFNYRIDLESISSNKACYSDENGYATFKILSMLLSNMNIAEDIVTIFHEYRHKLQNDFQKETKLEDLMKYPSNFITLIKNKIPIIIEMETKKMFLGSYYFNNYKKIYIEVDAESFAKKETSDFLYNLYLLYPNKNKELEKKILLIQKELINEIQTFENYDKKNTTESFEIYIEETNTSKEITSKIINPINSKEEDSLLFIDQTFKNNLDKISFFNILSIYLKDNRLKTYEEILKEKEEMLKLYDNNKVEEVFEYIIKSDPVLLFSKYIKNNDLENILLFLKNHPTFIKKYKKEIKKILKNNNHKSIIEIVKNTYYYIGVILLYLILSTRYNYDIKELARIITFTYFYSLNVIEYLVYLAKLIAKDVTNIITDKIYQTFKMMLTITIIFGIISPLTCKIIFNNPSYSIYLTMINFLAIFILLYDITYENIKNNKIIIISLLLGIITKIIITIPLINSFYRMGYNLMYGDILSTIVTMFLSIIINYIYLKRINKTKTNYFEKILDILYDNILLCIILLLVQFIIPLDTSNYFKSLGLIIIYLIISIMFIQIKNKKRG